ncbi:MAG TPA: hypothetical protein VIJ25_06780, partial [Methylococcales bacterium]
KIRVKCTFQTLCEVLLILSKPSRLTYVGSNPTTKHIIDTDKTDESITVVRFEFIFVSTSINTKQI